MKGKKLIALVLLGFVSFQLLGQEKFSINTTKKDSVNYYALNEFYFVHQVFADAFFLFDFYKKLNYDEMTQIVKTVLYKVDKDNKVIVTIYRNEEPNAKLEFFVEEGTENGTLLGMRVNYNAKEHKFLSDPADANSVVRKSYIKGDKLVYHDFLYSKKGKKEIKKLDNASELIDYYFFGDKKSNTKKVKGLIDKLLKDKSASKLETLYTKLYLDEYYLSNGDFDNCAKQIDKLQNYFDTYRDKGISYKDYFLIPIMAKTELEIMKRMQN